MLPDRTRLAPSEPTRPPGWLADCRGYGVESEGGRIGVVAEVGRGGDSGCGGHLVVRAGKIGRRLLVIPAEDVEVVLPASRLLLLRPGWTLLPASPRATAVGLPSVDH